MVDIVGCYGNTQFSMKLVTPLPVLGEIETYEDNRDQISSLDFLPTCKTAESASDKIVYVSFCYAKSENFMLKLFFIVAAAFI